MLALALAVVGIAVPDSLNPTLIIGALYLALADHPFRRTLAFTVAAFLVTLAGGLAVALGLGDLIRSLVPALHPTVKWTVLLVVGVGLVCGAAVLWWKRDSVVESEPGSRQAAEHPAAGGGSALVMGASIAGVEFLTAFPYFAAIAMVLGASVSTGGKVFLILLYNVVYVSPLIAVVIVCGVMGQAGAKRLAPVADWIATRWPIVVAPLIGVVGLVLAVYGGLKLS